MLLFLILCIFIRALRGSPFPTPLANSSVATADAFVATSESSDCGAQSLRSVATIVKSCLLTILACVWTSIHPNINGPTDSGWASVKRKAVIMFCAVIAPEFVFFWAIAQYVGAKQIAEDYNKKFAEPVVEKTNTLPLWRRIQRCFPSVWRKVVSWFRPLPKEITRRSSVQPWTTAHGFFVQMGGFMLYENDYPKEVLDYDRLLGLIEDKAIDAPTVTERDLQDRGKGDATAKAIVLLQTTWFVVQCIARWAQHLPVTELEVLTLAFAVINAAIYAAWWDKPQGVEVAICVPLKIGEQENTNLNAKAVLTNEALDEPENQAHSDGAVSFSQLDYQQSNDSVPLIPPSDQKLQPKEQIDEGHSWLWRQLKKDRQNHTLPRFLLICLPYRLSGFMLRPFYKMLGSNERKSPLRVQMIHIDTAEGIEATAELCLILLGPLVVGTIFGAIHLTAWASEFPSHRDLVLWRVSAIVLVAQPFLIALSGVLVKFFDDLDLVSGWVEDTIMLFLLVPPALMIPCYIAARFIVIFIAFKAIRHPPDNVLVDITWTTYIPHF